MTPSTPSRTLDLARLAQWRAVSHMRRPHAVSAVPCRRCKDLDLLASARTRGPRGAGGDDRHRQLPRRHLVARDHGRLLARGLARVEVAVSAVRARLT